MHILCSPETFCLVKVRLAFCVTFGVFRYVWRFPGRSTFSGDVWRSPVSLAFSGTFGVSRVRLAFWRWTYNLLINHLLSSERTYKSIAHPSTAPDGGRGGEDGIFFKLFLKKHTVFQNSRENAKVIFQTIFEKYPVFQNNRENAKMLLKLF